MNIKVEPVFAEHFATGDKRIIGWSTTPDGGETVVHPFRSDAIAGAAIAAGQYIGAVTIQVTH